VKELICSCSDGYIRVWDYNSNNFKHAIFSGFDGWLFGLCLIDQKYLLVGCGNGTIKEYNLDTNHLIYSLNGNSSSGFRIFTIKCYEINGKRFLISHSDKGLIDIWDEEI